MLKNRYGHSAPQAESWISLDGCLVDYEAKARCPLDQVLYHLKIRMDYLCYFDQGVRMNLRMCGPYQDSHEATMIRTDVEADL